MFGKKASSQAEVRPFACPLVDEVKAEESTF
jgi:hypothetical protein